MTGLQDMDTAAKVVVDYAVRVLTSRMLAHPRLDEDPTPVIANERDKLLDELWRVPAESRDAPNKVWAEAKTRENGHAVSKARGLR